MQYRFNPSLSLPYHLLENSEIIAHQDHSNILYSDLCLNPESFPVKAYELSSLSCSFSFHPFLLVRSIGHKSSYMKAPSFERRSLRLHSRTVLSQGQVGYQQQQSKYPGLIPQLLLDHNEHPSVSCRHQRRAKWLTFNHPFNPHPCSQPCSIRQLFSYWREGPGSYSLPAEQVLI